MKQELIMTNALGKELNYHAMSRITKQVYAELSQLRRQRVKANETLLQLIHAGRACSHNASETRKEATNLYKRIKYLQEQIHILNRFNIAIKNKQ